MAYQFIRQRDFDSTPASYEKYLLSTYENAKRILGYPVQQWPRGDSHTINRAVMVECEMALADLRMECGQFDQNGSLVGLAERH